jgi:hypothetical protein
VFGRLLFSLCLGGQFSEVLHHRIRIDLADGAELLFKLALTFEFVFEFLLALKFAFVLELAFAEQAANHVADGA